MRKATLLAFLLTGFQSLYSQTIGLLDLKRFGGTSSDYFSGIIQLSNGNYVCYGGISSADKDGAGNHGGTDILLTCISPRGQVLWKKLLGGTGEESAQGAAPAPDGGFFITGGTTSLDGDLAGNKGSYDVFVMKLDRNGNLLSSKTFGGTNTDNGRRIGATADGGCVFLAECYSDNNGDVPANHGGDGKGDAWLVKLSATGVMEWSKLFGGTGHDVPTSLAKTGDGGYVLSVNTASGDGDLTGTVAQGRTDLWILKVSSTGSLLWSNRIGGSDDDDGGNVLVAASGDIFVSANSRSANGNLPSNAGLVDIVFAKLTANGNTVFIKALGTSAWDGAGPLTESKDGQILLTAFSYGFSFNGQPPFNKGECDLILLKMDKTSGTQQWSVMMGGNGREFPGGVTVTPVGDIIMVGQTNSVNGDFPNSLGSYDAFFMQQAAFNAIKGYVFYDYDGDGFKLPTEPMVTNIRVITTKANAYSVSSYTEDGNYSNEVDSGTFVTRPRLFKEGYFTIKPDSFKNTFPGYYGSVTRIFGLRPIPGKRDLQSQLWALTPARPGFESRYRLICYNAGTDTIAAGTVTLVMDPRVSFLSSAPVQNSVTGNTITWQYTKLRPLDTLTYDIKVKVGIPPQVQSGQWLKFKSTIDPVAGDLVPSDNNFTLYHLVTGSYDPNDKTEAHGPWYSPTLLASGEPLLYTIRFQNTGTDTAFNVEIKDTLDNKLDANSLELITTSHPASFVVANGVCTWKFHNILLPDSNRNEPASHGYIIYRIKPAAAAHANDTIRNAASIYFDYNEPVKTNTSQTIIRLPEPSTPEVGTVAVNLCQVAPTRQVKILNVPDLEYEAIVSAKIDNQPIVVNTDSSVKIDPSALAAGNHTLTVAYTNSSAMRTVSRSFEIGAAVTPEVDLTTNMEVVTDLQSTITLQANPVKGGGSAPQYTFARDRLFTTVLQAQSTNNKLSLSPSSLTVGNNTYYVKIRTSDTCYVVQTAIDSVNIRRSEVTAVIDPADPSMVITASPIPFHRTLTISGLNTARTYYLQVYDGVGRGILKKQAKGVRSLQINVALPSGIGYLAIYDARMQLIGTIRIIHQ